MACSARHGPGQSLPGPDRSAASTASRATRPLSGLRRQPRPPAARPAPTSPRRARFSSRSMLALTNGGGKPTERAMSRASSASAVWPSKSKTSRWNPADIAIERARNGPIPILAAKAGRFVEDLRTPRRSGRCRPAPAPEPGAPGSWHRYRWLHGRPEPPRARTRLRGRTGRPSRAWWHTAAERSVRAKRSTPWPAPTPADIGRPPIRPPLRNPRPKPARTAHPSPGQRVRPLRQVRAPGSAWWRNAGVSIDQLHASARSSSTSARRSWLSAGSPASAASSSRRASAHSATLAKARPRRARSSGISSPPLGALGDRDRLGQQRGLLAMGRRPTGALGGPCRDSQARAHAVRPGRRDAPADRATRRPARRRSARSSRRPGRAAGAGSARGSIS